MIRKLLIRGRKEYGGHSHSFEGVIQALPDDPAWLMIAGFEDLYSKQEQEMLLDPVLLSGRDYPALRRVSDTEGDLLASA